MYRDQHRKYVPTCPSTIEPVDQYLWGQTDTNKYTCNNGISNAIYNCQGEIHFSLPLHEYPPVHDVHPQIAMTHPMHFNFREDPRYISEFIPAARADINKMRESMAGNVERFEPGSGSFRPRDYPVSAQKFISDYRPAPPVGDAMFLGLNGYPQQTIRERDSLGKVGLISPNVTVFTNKVPGYALPDPYELHAPCGANRF